MLGNRSVTVQHPHYFKFCAHSLPRKSTVDHQTQQVCLRLYALDNSLANVIAHAKLPQLHLDRLRQQGEHLLLSADACLASVAKAKQIPIMQAIKAVWL